MTCSRLLLCSFNTFKITLWKQSILWNIWGRREKAQRRELKWIIETLRKLLLLFWCVYFIKDILFSKYNTFVAERVNSHEILHAPLTFPRISYMYVWAVGQVLNDGQWGRMSHLLANSPKTWCSITIPPFSATMILETTCASECSFQMEGSLTCISIYMS